MRPNKKLIIPRRNAASINKARRNKAKAYMDEAQTLGNLYNAFINWFNSVPSLGGATDYIIGNAPVGGRRIRLLSPKQVETLAPRVKQIYKNAVNRVTERDAMNDIYGNRSYRDAYDDAMEESASRMADQEYFDKHNINELGFDPEMEWLEYKYGGTDTYPYLYNDITKRRGLRFIDATGLNY